MCEISSKQAAYTQVQCTCVLVAWWWWQVVSPIRPPALSVAVFSALVQAVIAEPLAPVCLVHTCTHRVNRSTSGMQHIPTCNDTTSHIYVHTYIDRPATTSVHLSYIFMYEYTCVYVCVQAPIGNFYCGGSIVISTSH